VRSPDLKWCAIVVALALCACERFVELFPIRDAVSFDPDALLDTGVIDTGLSVPPDSRFVDAGLSGPDANAGGAIDAPPGGLLDARPGVPDARPVVLDAPAGALDAPTGVPDARPAVPDARPAVLDVALDGPTQ
jgi:hypothetical protein